MSKYGIGWAWATSFGICHFAESSKDALLLRGKPSPEAVPTLVKIEPIFRKHLPKEKAQ